MVDKVQVSVDMAGRIAMVVGGKQFFNCVKKQPNQGSGRKISTFDMMKIWLNKEITGITTRYF